MHGSINEVASREEKVRISRKVIEDNNQTKTLLCHKSLFGAIDLRLVRMWAAYYKLLGFDEVYIWHVPSILQLPGVDELARTPYITLVENARGRVKTYQDGYTRLVRGVPGDQHDDEKACIRVGRQRNFDWVMMADMDEYLWFGEKIRLPEFLQKYAPSSSSNVTYLSFGKWMYTLEHKVEVTPPSFELSAVCILAVA